MRPAFVTLASALTLVGGHLLNRRWDRAALIFIVFAALWLGTQHVLFSSEPGNSSPHCALAGKPACHLARRPPSGRGAAAA